jgi:hypothetical protein
MSLRRVYSYVGRLVRSPADGFWSIRIDYKDPQIPNLPIFQRADASLSTPAIGYTVSYGNADILPQANYVRKPARGHTVSYADSYRLQTEQLCVNIEETSLIIPSVNGLSDIKATLAEESLPKLSVEGASRVKATITEDSLVHTDVACG